MQTRRLGNAPELESLGRVGLRLLLTSCHNQQWQLGFAATQSGLVPIRALRTDSETYDDCYMRARPSGATQRSLRSINV